MRNYHLIVLSTFLLFAMLGVQVQLLAIEKSGSSSISDPVTSKNSQEKKWVAAQHEYLLQPGDRVKVKIYPEDKYIKGGEMDISGEGNITLSLVGKIHIAGMTPTEAERVIAKVVDTDYLVNPEVAVEIVGRQESIYSVLVLGQVKNPGTHSFPASSEEFTLLQAISAAGGFSPIANPKKVKIMRRTGGKKSKVLRVNTEAVLSGKDPDVELEPGDVIHVSESLF